MLSVSRQSAWVFWSIFLTYVGLVVVGSCFHAVWRDEVLPVTLVTQSHSLFDLFHNIKNYGHPGLWFTILYYAYHIFPHYSVLKIVNFIVNTIAAYIFLKKAPFSWWYKILFLLGYFPFYFFPIVNRSYGLCWLLFLCFCVLYSQRWQKIILLSGVLFLLANTHAEGLIIVLAIGLTLAGEFFLRRLEVLKQNSIKSVYLGAVIVALGIVASLYQLRTDSSSIILSGHSLTLDKIVHSFKVAVFLPGMTFQHILGGEHVKVVTLAIFGCYFLLCRQWVALSLLLLSTIGLSLFLQIIFPGYDPYHESFVYMLMVFAFWITAGKQKQGSFSFYLWNLFFIGVLLSQVLMSYPAIKSELVAGFSSSKDFAQWINTQPSGNNYVLIGEPDFLIESMPYYVSNDIYIPREHRFSKITLDTTANQKEFSLEDFLYTAETLKTQGRSVYLVMGQALKKEGPFEVHFSYGKIFRYSPEAFKLWDQKTRKVAGFHRSYYDGGENYDVFVLR